MSLRERVAQSKRKSYVGALVIMALLAVWGGTFMRKTSQAETGLQNDFSEATLAEGFELPTAVDWAPDGRMFVSEKAGRVHVVTNGAKQLLYDISRYTDTQADQGLIGLAVDSNFTTNRYLYLLYTYDPDPVSTATNSSRLTRVTVNPDNTLENPDNPETVILGKESASPCPPASNDLDCLATGGHTANTVRSDKDGTLWVSIGDGGQGFNTYSEVNYVGKILHIDREGNGLPGHPFCPTDADLTHVCTKVYAKGFRNPFRFSLRDTGGPVVGDVGQSYWEELNLVQPGKNYGWPCYEGNARYSGFSGHATCSGPGGEYSKEGTADASMPPSYVYEHTDGKSASITAGPTYMGSTYPEEYKGSVFYGDYAQGYIKRLKFNAQGQVTENKEFSSGVYPVAIEQSPAGNIAYIDIAAGVVKEIRYTPGNQPPVVKASATPYYGPTPLTVQFSSEGTEDPNNDTLTYSWDFGDGTQPDATANPTHTYETAGHFVAKLTVGDPNGLVNSKTIDIYSGNTPPVPKIEWPLNQSKFTFGKNIIIAGLASDSEEGTLAADKLKWEVILHHGSHQHYVNTTVGKSGFGFTTTTDHDADSHYEIRLTATDSQDASTTTSITIWPNTVLLNLEADPVGSKIDFGGSSYLTPQTKEVAVGYKTTLNAPLTFHDATDKWYKFVQWSDNGPAFRNITIPNANVTLKATYQNPFGAKALYRYSSKDTNKSDIYYTPNKNNGLIYFGWNTQPCEAGVYTVKGTGMTQLFEYKNDQKGEHVLTMGKNDALLKQGYTLMTKEVMYAYPTPQKDNVQLYDYVNAAKTHHLYITTKSPALAYFGYKLNTSFVAYVPPPPAHLCK
jgi:glucose/arabinose dehydrogenase